jgi:hypothetical protein
MKALKISTTGKITALKDTSLESLQTEVDGWVQAVDLDGLTLWCNEEGKMNGLSHNPYAQGLWDAVYGAETDYIVGDIVLTGGTDEEGEIIPLTQNEAFSIKKTVSFLAKLRKDAA